MAPLPRPPEVQEIDTLTPYGVFLRYDEPAADAVLERERALELVRVGWRSG